MPSRKKKRPGAPIKPLAAEHQKEIILGRKRGESPHSIAKRLGIPRNHVVKFAQERGLYHRLNKDSLAGHIHSDPETGKQFLDVYAASIKTSRTPARLRTHARRLGLDIASSRPGKLLSRATLEEHVRESGNYSGTLNVASAAKALGVSRDHVRQMAYHDFDILLTREDEKRLKKK